MKWTTHSLFGAALTSIVLLIFQKGVMPAVIIIGTISALFPDIDHPNSKASNANPFFKIISVFVIIAITIFNFIFNLLTSFLNIFKKQKIKQLTGVHRSPISHSLMTVGFVALLTSPLLALGLPLWWFIGIVVGVLSHVLIDSLNPSGTPLLWPIYQGRVKFLPEMLAPITGSPTEGLVTLGVIILLGASLLVNYQLFGFNGQDFQDIFDKSGINLSIKHEVPEYDWSGINMRDLPPGSVKLPNGEVVLPDGRALSALSMQELEKIGIKESDLKDIGFTEDEITKFKEAGKSFLEESGITDLFEIFKSEKNSSITTTVSIPGAGD